MPFKASAGHHDRFVVETEVGVPGNPAVKDNLVMDGNIGTQISVCHQEEEEYNQFCP